MKRLRCELIGAEPDRPYGDAIIRGYYIFVDQHGAVYHYPKHLFWEVPSEQDERTP